MGKADLAAAIWTDYCRCLPFSTISS